MLRTLLIVLCLAVIGSGAFVFLAGPRVGNACTLDETGEGPSGRALLLCEVLYEVQPSNERWVVVRVVDVALADTPPGVDHADHDWACETWGLPAVDVAPRPTRIIVQIMASAFVRGEPAPGITQSIEAYTPQDGACAWEFL